MTEDRRKVSPFTPLIYAVSAVPPVAFFLFFLATGVGIGFGFPAFLGGLLLFFGIPTLVVVYTFLSWQRLWFWFDEDGDFRVDSGILFRQQRRLQLSRLQAVDVVQPIIARLVRFASVNVEVAGVSDSRVRLSYLPLREAQELRAEILARAAGVRPDAGEAPSDVMFKVPTGRLAGSLLLRSSTLGLFLVSIGFLVVTLLNEGWGGLALVVTTGGLPILIVLVEFITFYGFTAARSPDGIRLRFGLLQTQSRTVPPGRVQAIDIVEPWIWRRLGWVRVRINIAGVQGQSNNQQNETILTPVSPRAEAFAALREILPDVDLDALPWQSAPTRARWRSPVQWRLLAAAQTDAVFAIRRGLITRHRAVVPHSRVQSVRITQGPWQRWLGLATMHVDSTPGPVRVSALQQDVNQARRLAETESELARTGRSQDHSTKWMAPERNI
jgi:putative membrane protein